jgi:hypothetical protein
VYNGAGQRIRKVTESAITENGSTSLRKIKETLYLTGVEILRKYTVSTSATCLSEWVTV